MRTEESKDSICSPWTSLRVADNRRPGRILMAVWIALHSFLLVGCEEKLPDKDDMESAAQHNEQGVRALNSADLNRALAHFQKATELDSVTPDYPNNIGIVYLNQSEFGQAREAFENALERDPRYVRAHYNMGVAYQNDGQPERAAEAYRNALRLSPGEIPALYNLGLVLMRTGELEEAREAFQSFLSLAPEEVQKPRADALSRIEEINRKIGTGGDSEDGENDEK